MAVTIHEAESQLTTLLILMEAGEEVAIARDGKPVARLEPYDRPPARRFGFLDLGDIPDSACFEPMTEEELAEWE